MYSLEIYWGFAVNSTGNSAYFAGSSSIFHMVTFRRWRLGGRPRRTTTSWRTPSPGGRWLRHRASRYWPVFNWPVYSEGFHHGRCRLPNRTRNELYAYGVRSRLNPGLGQNECSYVQLYYTRVNVPLTILILYILLLYYPIFNHITMLYIHSEGYFYYLCI